MSYEPGKMGAAQGTVLVFTAPFISFFLSMWSVLVDQAATIAWCVPMIGAISAIPAFLTLFFVMQRVPGDLYQVSERLVGKIGAKLITLYLIITFFIDGVLTVRQFAENTLITAIPGLNIFIVAGWYLLVAAIFVYLGIETISRAAYVVLPMGIAAILLLLLMLYNKFNLYQFWPWLGEGVPEVLKTGFLSSGFFLHVIILAILAPSFQNLKTIRTAFWLGTGLSAFVRTITLFVYIGVYGVAVGREKILPFYEMARLIYISRYLQRVEAFFIILWVIFGIGAIAIDLYVVTYLLTRLFNLPALRPLILTVTIIMSQVALMPSDIATTVELNVMADTVFFTSGVFAIPAILAAAMLIKGKRTVKPCAIK